MLAKSYTQTKQRIHLRPLFLQPFLEHEKTKNTKLARFVDDTNYLQNLSVMFTLVFKEIKIQPTNQPTN